jgi:hypothetical protein
VSYTGRVTRRGFSLAEVAFAIFIFVCLFLPAYTLFIQSRDTTFRSKLAYIAIHVAREEIEDLRILTRVTDDYKTLAHGWRKVEGDVIERPLTERKDGPSLKDVSLATPTAEDKQARTELTYPKEYARIFTKLDVNDSTDGNVYPCVMHVQWQEKGEAVTDASKAEKQGFSEFEFFLVRPTRGL